VAVEGNAHHFIPALEHAALFLSEHFDLEHRPSPALAASLLREIVGNLSRPLPEVRAFGGLMRIGWLTDTVRALAEPIYDEHAFDRLPILADALQEAGCNLEDILHHCRGQERCPTCLGHGWVPRPSALWHLTCPDCEGTGWLPLRGPHVRGCWVLDHLLGYS
jgi:hypothetical protein